MTWRETEAEVLSGFGGLIAILAADLPGAGRILGAVVTGCAMISLFGNWQVRRGGTAARSASGLELAPAANRAAVVHAAPMKLPTGTPGTAQDVPTAMRLFGSAIVEQVDTSVSTVLTENHQMREMGSEMPSAATQTIGEKISQMSSTVTQSVAALQGLFATIESVDAASNSIGQSIAEQEQLAARVSASMETIHGGVFTFSREIREAAQIAANSGMLSDLVLETANSVNSVMNELKLKLQDISAGMGPRDSLRPVV